MLTISLRIDEKNEMKSGSERGNCIVYPIIEESEKLDLKA